MIDLQTESVISLNEASHALPKFRGKRVSLCTLHRWCQRGTRGVKLESARIGGRLVTSKEALSRFSERLTDPQGAGRVRVNQARVAAAERQLEREGL